MKISKSLLISSILLAGFSLHCGGGGSGGAATAPSSSSSTSTVGGATSPGSGATTPPSATALASALQGPSGLGSGLISIRYRLVDPQSRSVDVAVEFTTDGSGWSSATLASGSSGVRSLATLPAPGADHQLIWDSATDLPGRFEPSVAVRVTPLAGVGAVATPFAVDNTSMATGVSLARRPYLQSMTSNSVIVVWKTVQPVESVVEYGSGLGLGQVARQAGARTEHALTLSGLAPGSIYYYRLSSAQGPLTSRIAFRTAPASNVSDFTFIAFGDSGTGSQAQMDLAQRMSADSFDLILHTGDVVYPAGEARHYDPRFFTPYADMLQRAPIFPAVGNHDLITLGLPYSDAFHLPSNNSLNTELYYSFEYGDAKFISLDTTVFGHIPFGPHMSWLQTELASNSRRWLIVYFHIPIFSSGTHGNDRILEYNLLPLLEGYGVDLVVSGHDHNYERFNPIKRFNNDPAFPGIPHIVTGGGGAGTRGVSRQSDTAYAERCNHYTRFEVSRDRIRGQAIRIDGAIIDSFDIVK